MEEVEKGHLGFAPHGMVALGMLNEKKAIPLVQALLKDKTDPVLVREGALALALLRGSAASTELVAMLKEANTTWTRGSIAYALGFVGNEKSVEPLLEIYRDKTRQGEQRAIALAALGRIGDPDEIPLLATLAHNLNPYVVVEAVAEALTIL